jgi:hypothetical protein
MFRRIRRQIEGALNPIQMQMLTRANQLANQGNPQQAAVLYSSLAAELQASNHPRRAANLFAQAAHAFADSRQADQAVAQAKTALNLFIQYQMVERAPRFFGNIVAKLRHNGMVPAANLLEQTYGHRFQGMPEGNPAIGPEPAANESHGRLPAACPKCGAPVNPAEIDWLDRENAECNYCGATLQTN